MGVLLGGEEKVVEERAGDDLRVLAGDLEELLQRGSPLFQLFGAQGEELLWGKGAEGGAAEGAF